MICHHRSARLHCEYVITIPTDASVPRGPRKIILVIWAKFTPIDPQRATIVTQNSQ